MARVVVYTKQYCPYCTAAKALLRSKGVSFEEKDIDDDTEKRQWLASVSGQRTVPQVFVNGRPLGGYTDIAALDDGGELDRLLSEPDVEVPLP